MILDLDALLVSFVAAIIFAAAIFLSRPLHIRFTAKGHAGTAVQSSHDLPTPRIGGVAVLFGALCGAYFLTPEAMSVATLLLASMLPVFLGGLGEDTGFDVSSKIRLLLSFVSALVAGMLLGMWVPRLGVPGIDLITAFAPTAILLTVIVSGGISHSINLIDGLNGLSIGVSIAISLGLAFIAASFDDYVILSILSLIIGGLGGLLLFNFPFGKVFMGDAGAYSMGHVLPWIGILLLNRHPEVAPFSILLIFFWPIADMLFSMIRRYRSGKPVDQPDRLHFHQLAMRTLEMTFMSRKLRSITNPLATIIILPFAIAPIVLATFVARRDLWAVAAFVVAGILFVASYKTAVYIARRYSR